MIKYLKVIILGIIIVTGTLYTGILGLLADNIDIFLNDFLPYIPLEIRLGFFMVILSLTFAFKDTFTK